MWGRIFWASTVPGTVRDDLIGCHPQEANSLAGNVSLMKQLEKNAAHYVMKGDGNKISRKREISIGQMN